MCVDEGARGPAAHSDPPRTSFDSFPAHCSASATSLSPISRDSETEDLAQQFHALNVASPCTVEQQYTTRQPRKWSPLDDEILLFNVKDSGRRWVRMSRLLPGRTPGACRHRYKRITSIQGAKTRALAVLVNCDHGDASSVCLLSKHRQHVSFPDAHDVAELLSSGACEIRVIAHARLYGVTLQAVPHREVSDLHWVHVDLQHAVRHASLWKNDDADRLVFGHVVEFLYDLLFFQYTGVQQSPHWVRFVPEPEVQLFGKTVPKNWTKYARISQCDHLADRFEPRRRSTRCTSSIGNGSKGQIGGHMYSIEE
ncbi:hypothetical protein AB1Y20_008599 [Prymnesium parvum]|uniref:Myb-like domain-containing protein n=1 Tax=Prymnesium parvum TaxID=97485 RepID=A0AB34IQS0_PRYPA